MSPFEVAVELLKGRWNFLPAVRGAAIFRLMPVVAVELLKGTRILMPVFTVIVPVFVKSSASISSGGHHPLLGCGIIKSDARLRNTLEP